MATTHRTPLDPSADAPGLLDAVDLFLNGGQYEPHVEIQIAGQLDTEGLGNFDPRRDVSMGGAVRLNVTHFGDWFQRWARSDGGLAWEQTRLYFDTLGIEPVCLADVVSVMERFRAG